MGPTGPSGPCSARGRYGVGELGRPSLVVAAQERGELFEAAVRNGHVGGRLSSKRGRIHATVGEAPA